MKLTSHFVLMCLVVICVTACGPEKSSTARPVNKVDFPYPLAQHPGQYANATGRYKTPGRVVVEQTPTSALAAGDMAVQTKPIKTTPLSQPKSQPKPQSQKTQIVMSDKRGQVSKPLPAKQPVKISAKPLRSLTDQSTDNKLPTTPDATASLQAIPMIARANADALDKPDHPAVSLNKTPHPKATTQSTVEKPKQIEKPKTMQVHLLQGTDIKANQFPGITPVAIQKQSTNKLPVTKNVNNKTPQTTTKPTQKAQKIIIGPDAGDVFVYQHVVRRVGDYRSGYEYVSLLVNGAGKIRIQKYGITGKNYYKETEDPKAAAKFLKDLQKLGFLKLKSRHIQLKDTAKNVSIGSPIAEKQQKLPPGYQLNAVIDGKLIGVAYPGLQAATIPPEQIRDIVLLVRKFILTVKYKK